MPESPGLPTAANQGPDCAVLTKYLVPGTSITAEYALLCCFGAQTDESVSGKRLRHALVSLGYRPLIARRLVRTSPLLDRERRDTYRIRSRPA